MSVKGVLSLSGESFVSIENVRVQFGANEVLKGINLKVFKGEFLTLLGPSGCGKTTLLRTIAGFTTHHDGSILINGKDVTKLPPYERNIGMVFQDYALWPHKNVEEHISFGLKLAKLSPEEINKRIKWALKLVGLSGLEHRFPSELSGGQRQRVALARAISLHPTVLLMDEPLSNLDRKLRDDMRIELRALQKNLDITAIYVTHDQAEALAMSDRIAVMKRGQIEQISDPFNLYEKPCSIFVAQFLGINNILPVKVITFTMGKATVRLTNGRSLVLPVSNDNFTALEAFLLLPPESIVFTDDISEQSKILTGQVTDVVFEGKEIRYKVLLDDVEVSLELNSRYDPCALHNAGDKVCISFRRGYLIPKEEG